MDSFPESGSREPASTSNTIRFHPTSADGLPNIDYLDVTTSDPPPPPPPSAALYVATNGNDANPGTLSQPLRTVQRAVDLAQAGHTIYLRGGTYAPSGNIRLLKNGSSRQPITRRNYNGERAIIDGETATASSLVAAATRDQPWHTSPATAWPGTTRSADSSTTATPAP